MMLLRMLGRFWFVIPIALLSGYCLWVRGDLAAAQGDLKAANGRVEELTTANAGLASALDTVRAQRVDNDAIAEAVAGKLAGNTTRETHTQTIIEKAVANDPATNSWAFTPVPRSVRDALRPH